MNAPDDLALLSAQQTAYDLFGSLLQDGLTKELYFRIEPIDELMAAARPFVVDGELDADELAAQHQRLFGFEVFPLESVFLDPNGLAGGAPTQAVLDDYQRLGLSPVFKDHGPDHLGHHLVHLGALLGAEAEAWADGAQKEAQGLRRHQARWLDHHVLSWLLPLLEAIRHEDTPVFSTLMELIEALVIHHREALQDIPLDSEVPLLEVETLQTRLEDPSTSLQTIAETLLIPAASGLFISRSALSTLGRPHRLPAGFGARTDLLHNLLRSAVHYDALRPVTASLTSRFESAAEYYDASSNRHPDFIGRFAQPWSDQCRKTVHALKHTLEPALANT